MGYWSILTHVVHISCISGCIEHHIVLLGSENPDVHLLRKVSSKPCIGFAFEVSFHIHGLIEYLYNHYS